MTEGRVSRSEQMARIRGTGTKPERELLALLEGAIDEPVLYQEMTPGGRVDFVFAASRMAVLVDGCFWHGCPDHYVRPRTREEFWATKLRANVSRDRRQMGILHGAGWTVVRLWEHELRRDPVAAVARVLARDSEVFNDWRVVRVEVLDANIDLERRWEELLLDPSASRVVERRRTTHKG